jgi:response regulator of citrate/malate metabolism
MKEWTIKNLQDYTIKPIHANENSKSIAQWVWGHIFLECNPSNIQEMLDNANDYIELAAKSMNYSLAKYGNQDNINYTSSGVKLKVNIK